MQKLLPIVVISVFFTSEATAQSTGDAKPYHVEEAYKVYSLVLPHEESYGFAKRHAEDSENTVAEDVTEACLAQADTHRFKDAIAGYNRVYKGKWTLQRHFQIEKPYRIVGLDASRRTRT
jgi:hypothetical protein